MRCSPLGLQLPGWRLSLISGWLIKGDAARFAIHVRGCGLAGGLRHGLSSPVQPHPHRSAFLCATLSSVSSEQEGERRRQESAVHS